MTFRSYPDYSARLSYDYKIGESEIKNGCSLKTSWSARAFYRSETRWIIYSGEEKVVKWVYSEIDREK